MNPNVLALYHLPFQLRTYQNAESTLLLKLCQSIHNIEFTVLTILCVQFGGCKYVPFGFHFVFCVTFQGREVLLKALLLNPSSASESD